MSIGEQVRTTKASPSITVSSPACAMSRLLLWPLRRRAAKSKSHIVIAYATKNIP